MSKAKPAPKTGAERARAYRQRLKPPETVAAAPPPKLEPEPDKPDDPEWEVEMDDGAEVSINELNARMRRMAKRAFDELGGVAFLKRVANKNPNTFLRFAGQFITREDTINPGAYNFYIQKLTIEGALPVRGVIASPVAGHVGGSARLLDSAAGEVIEEQLDA